mmetsp:Transcript_56105/g.163928  ORF Transcript_56105/g.163928 Transcript_56105/m.163928 type:complete len:314 (-) Transcript_56105:32-973(-)
MNAAAIPDDEIAGTHAHQPRPCVGVPPEERVRAREWEEVVLPPQRPSLKDLAMVLVRPRKDRKPAGGLVLGRQGHEALGAHELAAGRAAVLVCVEPPALCSPVRIQSRGPEGTGAIEAHHELAWILQAPDVREGTEHRRPRAHKPHEGCLADAGSSEEAVRRLPWPGGASPSLRLVAADLPASAVLQEVPEKAGCGLHLLRAQGLAEDGVPVLLEVLQRGGVTRLEARRVDAWLLEEGWRCILLVPGVLGVLPTMTSLAGIGRWWLAASAAASLHAAIICMRPAAKNETHPEWEGTGCSSSEVDGTVPGPRTA